MAVDDQTPVPNLVHAFDLFVERCAPVVVGRLAAGGRRTHVSIGGGKVAGSELTGVLLGGSETTLDRDNSVTVIEASYLIRAEDGSIARAVGQGYRTAGGDFSGTRLSLLFEVDENGSLAHLARRAFIAEAGSDEADLAVMRID